MVTKLLARLTKFERGFNMTRLLIVALLASLVTGCGLAHLHHQRDAYNQLIEQEERRLGIPSRDQSLAASIEARYKAEVLVLEGEKKDLTQKVALIQAELDQRSEAFEAEQLEEMRKTEAKV